MTQKAFQDYYPDHLSHCYGCGRLNEHGLQTKSYWDGEEAVCTFHPKAYHIAVPGYVYGGLIASIIDCHFTPLRLLDPRLRGDDIVRAHRAASSVIPAKAGIHKQSNLPGSFKGY
jgi:hypothetical protein